MIYYGIDVHNRKSNYCGIDEEGNEIGTANFPTTKKGFNHHFGNLKPVKIAIEAGSHSHWIAKTLQEMGHEVVVANPRKVQLIGKNKEKDDKIDAEFLARLLRSDPKLLHGTHVRDEENLAVRGLVKARATLVACRTQLICSVRGLVKPFGAKIRKCQTKIFHEIAMESEMPASAKTLIVPLLRQIKSLTEEIAFQDQAIESLDLKEPTIQQMKAVPGIGNLIALAFISHVDDPNRFQRSEQVGKYFGLTTGRRFSGGGGYNLSITKEGDGQMRALLIQAAYAFLRSNKDSELKQWALKLMDRKGGRDCKQARKKTVVALARKLVVMLHRMWVTQQEYQPFYHTQKQAA